MLRQHHPSQHFLHCYVLMSRVLHMMVKSSSVQFLNFKLSCIGGSAPCKLRHGMKGKQVPLGTTCQVPRKQGLSALPENA